MRLRRATDHLFLFPRKKYMVCWDADDLESNGSKSSSLYFKELTKHIKVDLLNKSSEHYFSEVASCNFYLSFENSDTVTTSRRPSPGHWLPAPCQWSGAHPGGTTSSSLPPHPSSM